MRTNLHALSITIYTNPHTYLTLYFFNFLTCKRNDASKSIKIQTWNAECIRYFQTELNSANIYELLDTTLTADSTKKSKYFK